MGIKGCAFHETNFGCRSRCSLLGGVPGFSGEKGVRCHSKATALVLKAFAKLGFIENKIHEIEMGGETHYLNRNSLIKWLEAQPECPQDDDLNDCIQAVIDSKTRIDDLPHDVLGVIFSHLPASDLVRCARVNKKWKAAVDGADWATNLAVEEKERWRQHFGDVGEVPPLPPDIVSILKSRCPFWRRKKVWQTHWLVLVPGTVNGEPLTLNNLEKLAKPGYANRFRYFWHQARTQHGDVSTKSHWVLMTKDVIPRSRNKSPGEQRALVEKQAGYELPELLEATSCIFMQHAVSGAYSFGQINIESRTFTRCKETIGGHHLALGGFVPKGLSVYPAGDSENLGVAAVRRLCPLSPLESKRAGG